MFTLRCNCFSVLLLTATFQFFFNVNNSKKFIPYEVSVKIWLCNNRRKSTWLIWEQDHNAIHTLLRLPKLCLLLAVLLYVCFLDVFALIAYDHQTLLNL